MNTTPFWQKVILGDYDCSSCALDLVAETEIQSTNAGGEKREEAKKENIPLSQVPLGIGRRPRGCLPARERASRL